VVGTIGAITGFIMMKNGMKRIAGNTLMLVLLSGWLLACGSRVEPQAPVLFGPSPTETVEETETPPAPDRLVALGCDQRCYQQATAAATAGGTRNEDLFDAVMNSCSIKCLGAPSAS
jgi:hypothetical protein